MPPGDRGLAPAPRGALVGELLGPGKITLAGLCPLLDAGDTYSRGAARVWI